MEKLNIIKVLFLFKRNSPVNLKQMEYFVKTNNYEVAHDKALDQLSLDIDKALLRYYDKVIMSEIRVIKCLN